MGEGKSDRKEPEILGLSPLAVALEPALQIAKLAKNWNENLVTVFGNILATLVYRNLLKNYDYIDYCFQGEAENTISKFVQTVEQVQNLVDNLQGYSVIPIVLYPSEKNESSAKFLKLELDKYRENFAEFLNKVHQIAGDVLITSPSDFSGLNQFLENSSLQSTKYSASG